MRVGLGTGSAAATGGARRRATSSLAVLVAVAAAWLVLPAAGEAAGEVASAVELARVPEVGPPGGLPLPKKLEGDDDGNPTGGEPGKSGAAPGAAGGGGGAPTPPGLGGSKAAPNSLLPSVAPLLAPVAEVPRMLLPPSPEQQPEPAQQEPASEAPAASTPASLLPTVVAPLVQPHQLEAPTTTLAPQLTKPATVGVVTVPVAPQPPAAASTLEPTSVPPRPALAQTSPPTPGGAPAPAREETPSPRAQLAAAPVPSAQSPATVIPAAPPSPARAKTGTDEASAASLFDGARVPFTGADEPRRASARPMRPRTWGDLVRGVGPAASSLMAPTMVGESMSASPSLRPLRAWGFGGFLAPSSGAVTAERDGPSVAGGFLGLSSWVAR